VHESQQDKCLEMFIVFSASSCQRDDGWCVEQAQCDDDHSCRAITVVSIVRCS